MPNNFEVNDILEARFEGSLGPPGTRWNLVRHYRVTANDDEEIASVTWLSAMAEEIGSNFAVAILPLISEQVSYAFVRLKRIAPTQSVFAISATGAGPGDLSDPIGQPDAAVVVTFRTDLPSKRFLGRSYLVGLTDDLEVEGLVNAPHASSIREAFILLLTPQVVTDVGSCEMFHFSPTNYAQTGNVGQSAAPIVAVEVDRVVRRLTRRDYRVRMPVTEPVP